MAAPASHAVILARGLGTRMRRADGGAELTGQQGEMAALGVKAMIPVGRPFLDYVISGLADAGVTEVCLVIGPEHGVVRDHYSSGGRPRRVTVSFAVQERPLGTADAVAAAEAFAGGQDVLVLNSDNYYPVDAIRALAAVEGSGLVGFDAAALVARGNIPADRIITYALVEVDAEGLLVAIHEKPPEALFRALQGGGRSLVSMNLWKFTPAIFEACRRVTPSVRGELELQDAVHIARDSLGERFRVLRFSGGVLDLSSRGDVAEVMRRLRDVAADP